MSPGIGNDCEDVRVQYADESRLLTRTAVWRPAADGRTPQRVALDELVGAAPEHLARLLSDAGGEPLVTGFSTENGAAALRRHFEDVRRDDLRTEAVFPDHAAAKVYLATLDAELADGLPWFDGERRDAGASTVFLAC